jgi:hypothetical protein
MMEINADQLLENALREGMREGLKALMTRSYENPFEKVMKDGLARHAPAFHKLLSECVESCLGDATFRQQIAAQIRSTLAKTLVQRFGGEMERQVNQLKSDPATRARITLAIEAIVSERLPATS